MNTHILPVDFFDPDSFYPPPKKLIYLPYPKEEWYSEKDPLWHERILHLTRGIHLLNEWWQNQQVKISYPIADHAFYLIEALPELELSIRQLHKTLTPHQKIEDLYLVFGNGATQVINAALYAYAVFHSLQNNPPIKGRVPYTTLFVTEKLPGYLEDNTLTQMFHRNLVTWISYDDHKTLDSKHLLEFITTPNNPDGRILKAQTNAAYTIYDRVNHWSLFLNDDSSVQKETLEGDGCSIFSLSKILSFSGSRVGYAFVKDAQIAHFMKYYIIMSTHGLVSDSQYRCLIALRYLLDDPSRLVDYTNWVRRQLEKRWKLLHETMALTPMQLLNKQGPNAWIKVPGNASDYLMKKYRIEATYGDEYGATLDHARINLLSKTNEFDELIWRLKNF